MSVNIVYFLNAASKKLCLAPSCSSMSGKVLAFFFHLSSVKGLFDGSTERRFEMLLRLQFAISFLWPLFGVANLLLIAESIRLVSRKKDGKMETLFLNTLLRPSISFYEHFSTGSMRIDEECIREKIFSFENQKRAHIESSMCNYCREEDCRNEEDVIESSERARELFKEI